MSASARVHAAVLAAMASGCGLFPTARDPDHVSQWVFIDPKKPPPPPALAVVGAELEDPVVCSQACGYAVHRCGRPDPKNIFCERDITEAQQTAAGQRWQDTYDLQVPLVGEACRDACGGAECTLRRRASDGRLDVVCSDQPCVGGRRPPGWEAPPRREGVGGFFAEMAALEAASVTAFEELAAELTSHGAPNELIARAERAAADEVRHAAIMRALACLPCADAPRREAPLRSLFAIALDNAREGESSELVGAAIALWQSKHAARAREALASIAADEIEHAELAGDINAWILPQLTPSERAAVRRAREEAFARLAEPAREPAEALVREAGLPREAERQAIILALAG
jgi:hypothetical protein